MPRASHGTRQLRPMRVVVVGAGVVGLLTALECLEAGADVTVVEQGPIPSPRAASYDWHRIVRALHPGDPDATRAAVRAQRMWLRLERLLDIQFRWCVGTLTLLADESTADAAARSLSDAGARAVQLTGRQLAESYGHIRFPGCAAAVLEVDAGVVLADRAVTAAARRLANSQGARLMPGSRVVHVDTSSRYVHVDGQRAVPCDRVVITAGAWSRSLLPGQVSAGLTLHRQSMVYCRVPAAVRAAWSATPAVLAMGTARSCWLVPPVAGTPLKLSADSACRPVTELTGDRTPARWRDHIVNQFTGLLAGFEASWVTGSRDCYYLARTLTGGPLLGVLHEGAVLAYAACGGNSFKFAPLIARSLAQRVMGAEPAPTGLAALDHPELVTGTVEAEGGHDG